MSYYKFNEPGSCALALFLLTVAGPPGTCIVLRETGNAHRPTKSQFNFMKMTKYFFAALLAFSIGITACETAEETPETEMPAVEETAAPATPTADTSAPVMTPADTTAPAADTTAH